jgi:hypothetical protein
MVRTAALDASHQEERMEGEIMRYTFFRRRRMALTMGMGLLALAATAAGATASTGLWSEAAAAKVSAGSVAIIVDWNKELVKIFGTLYPAMTATIDQQLSGEPAAIADGAASNRVSRSATWLPYSCWELDSGERLSQNQRKGATS